MNITINDKEIAIRSDETLYEAATRIGCEIPTLCYAKGYRHKSSCMVCAVKNQADGQIMTSCSTYPVEGMRIETDSEEVRGIRRMSLELLLSDHRADCDAPCTMVCPAGLDVERMLAYYDAELYEKSYSILSEAFSLPELACDACKASCEKACRRGTVDKTVAIREIIREIAGRFDGMSESKSDVSELTDGMNGQYVGMSEQIPCGEGKTHSKTSSNLFQSRLGRFTECERERLKSTVLTTSRCLHCACAGRNGCKLRLYATAAGIKRPRYDTSTALPAMTKQHIKGNMWFEPAKCIRCGLCVYNSTDGFTFKGRGFVMEVVLPDENRHHIGEELAEICPTGAVYLIDN